MASAVPNFESQGSSSISITFTETNVNVTRAMSGTVKVNSSLMSHVANRMNIRPTSAIATIRRTASNVRSRILTTAADSRPTVSRTRSASASATAVNPLRSHIGRNLSSRNPDRITRSNIPRPVSQTRSNIQRPVSQTRSNIPRPVSQTRSNIPRPVSQTTSNIPRSTSQTRSNNPRSTSQSRSNNPRTASQTRNAFPRIVQVDHIHLATLESLENRLNTPDDSLAPGKLSKEELQYIPSYMLKSKRKEMCDICLEECRKGEEMRILPCIHQFHSRCIDGWLQKSATCPICRTTIRI